ncbi:hypothetical protein [Sharpea azabuensis]|uniref:hypothetical protein n=1 Tax=Sharpea azabuensis TaxID=322505 RepID=UPI001567DB05|nr:hypothetical protein [Sharpea azabuensis]
MMEESFLTIQKDSDETAWKFYAKFYGEQLNNRHFKIKGKDYNVSGDVCFNIKVKKNNRFTLLSSIIKDDLDSDKMKELNDLLTIFLHSPMNISLLPVTGGLNNIKGQFASDRFDSFLWLLDAYYKGLSAPILNRGTKNSYIGNQKILGNILNEIGSVRNFYSIFYGIDDDGYLDHLINNGKKAIVEPSDYYAYLLEAVRFWTIRLDLLVKKDIFMKNGAVMNDYCLHLQELKDLIINLENF